MPHLTKIIAASCLLVCLGVAPSGGSPVERSEMPRWLGPRAGGDQDTMAVYTPAPQWIATWSFDPTCSDAGWMRQDNRIGRDESNYWSVQYGNDYGTTQGNAAILAAGPWTEFGSTGYGNDWDYAIVLRYRGGGANPTLSFDFISDSEPGWDFVSVEADSAGASDSRVDYIQDPGREAAGYRDQLFVIDGPNPGNSVYDLPLPDYTPGDPLAEHCVYIRFSSDGAGSDADGRYLSQWGRPLQVDNILVTGGIVYFEDFSAAWGPPVNGVIPGTNPNITFANSAPATSFGEWARVFLHITDNDVCAENTSCAWLWSDPMTIAAFPDMAFGPGGAVIDNWLDDIIISPWVDLTLPGRVGRGAILSFRCFPGNRFDRGRVVLGWRARSITRVAIAEGDSVDLISPWGHAGSFSTLGEFGWTTIAADLTPHIDPFATQVQVAFRVSDWQLLAGEPPPAVLNPGPGPYIDDVKIGRYYKYAGPLLYEGIDSRSQAQDAFGAEVSASAPGEHHTPSTSSTRRFDPVPVDRGADLAVNGRSPNLIPGDSIHVQAVDAGKSGGIVSVRFHGAITQGPHTGKCPPGGTMQSSGFFSFEVDSCRTASGRAIAGHFYVDLPDDYLRGGDVLVYCWTTVDMVGAASSDPQRIPCTSGYPDVTSVAEAESLAGGLLEMSALPTINWDPAYLAAIAEDPSGAVEPTLEQIANSTQRSCILYYNVYNSRRRSGPTNRTSFMYTLDRLGYSGWYDVYDVQGYGNTNNQLGGRATVEHAAGYSLLIQDTGRLATTTLPNGSALDGEKIDQAQWYRDWLAGGTASESGTATLWALGENLMQEQGVIDFMGAQLGTSNLGSLRPTVLGVGPMTFWNGCVAQFATESFALNGGCPTQRNFDGLTATTGVATHRYQIGGSLLPYAAIVMNKNASQQWNTVLSAFAWFDIQDADTSRAAQNLATDVLSCVLPSNCLRSPDPTDADTQGVDLPRVTALHQNVPNPFNPTTTIHFDLACEGRVELRIYDVAGRVVKTLVRGKVAAGWDIGIPWSGCNEAGIRVPTGIYFYRLITEDYTATRKMLLMK